MIRLDKALADSGFGTRNDVKKLIRSGKVTVNGEVVKKADCKITGDEEIIADGIAVNYQEFTYLMLNKPKGVISATEGRDETVLDLIYEPVRGLFPCGRLDKDTEGLLIIMNDGPLAHELLSPKNRIEKEYHVVLRDPVSEKDIDKLAKGMVSGEDHFLPAYFTRTEENAGNIVITEGKYHEIKRMFLALGNEVTDLKRVRMKNLVLDPDLAPGDYRPLTEEELNGLKERPD